MKNDLKGRKKSFPPEVEELARSRAKEALIADASSALEFELQRTNSIPVDRLSSVRARALEEIQEMFSRRYSYRSKNDLESLVGLGIPLIGRGERLRNWEQLILISVRMSQNPGIQVPHHALTENHSKGQRSSLPPDPMSTAPMKSAGAAAR